MKTKQITEIINAFLNSDISEFGPPFSPGVYGVFVLKKFLEKPVEQLLYIGSSNNVFKRVSKPNHPYRLLFDRLSCENVLVYTKTLITKDYLETEKVLIKNLKPRLNKAYKW